MPAKKLRVEISDAQGNRYTLSCEGPLSREKMIQFLDLVELLGGTPADTGDWRRTSRDPSKFDRIYSRVKASFPAEWFSSRDAKRVCEQELNYPLSLSTVSTYLARMADRGFLIRKGPLNNRRYQVLTVPISSEANAVKDNK